MEESLETLYFEWLYAKVMLSDQPAQSYTNLIKALYDTEFVWLVVGDDNRAQDGLDLRSEFLEAAQFDPDCVYDFMFGCTVLEMLIAFSRRAEFQTDIRPNEWFWEFVTNLGLADHHDDDIDIQSVNDILYNFVWRTYDYTGLGGLFPLNNPLVDQTEIEIWYQFCAYLVEKGFD
jgi:hypothetical protein